MSGQEHNPVRHISDADAEAIANLMADTLKKRFYQDLGKGIWAWVWRGLLLGLIAFAATGGLTGLKGLK